MPVYVVIEREFGELNEQQELPTKKVQSFVEASSLYKALELFPQDKSIIKKRELVSIQEVGNIVRREVVKAAKKITKIERVLVIHDDNIIGSASSVEAARDYVKKEWEYSDEKIEDEMKDGILAFRKLEELEE